jgi:hypothetical protein
MQYIRDGDFKGRDLARELAIVLLPAALTVYLAFHSGGFNIGAAALAAGFWAGVVAVRFALDPRPLRALSLPALVAVLAMCCFAAWTLLSSNWSDSVGRVLPEYSRALLYALVLLFFATVPFELRRVRWLVYALGAAIVLICGAALVARLLPNLIYDSALETEDRLAYPLTYWNALGILGCVGAILAVHLTSTVREPPPVRVIAAAAIPLLSLSLFYTLSRGAIWAAFGAIALYALLGRPAALINGAIATIPMVAAVLVAAQPSSAVAHEYPTATLLAGRHMALILLCCVLSAALLRAAVLPLDGRLGLSAIRTRVPRPLLAGAAATALVLVFAAATAADAPHVVSTKAHEFFDRKYFGPHDAGEGRLFSAGTEGRFELWEVALDGYHENPLHGAGAGTYAMRWNRDRLIPTEAANAHSLYVEVLGELGIVGLILLVVPLALILGAFAYRVRGPDRALFAALFAAGLAWTAHAAVDWDWQMPAVTLWLFALGGLALAGSGRQHPGGRPSGTANIAVRVTAVAACALVAILPARVAVSQAHLVSAIDAIHDLDCPKAEDEAHAALAAEGERPAAYSVIALCAAGTDQRYGQALEAMREALKRDPENWAIYYQLAAIRARAGFDPRAAAAKAAELNPLGVIAQYAPILFGGTRAASWKRASHEAPVPAPTYRDP